MTREEFTRVWTFGQPANAGHYEAKATRRTITITRDRERGPLARWEWWVFWHDPADPSGWCGHGTGGWNATKLGARIEALLTARAEEAK